MSIRSGVFFRLDVPMTHPTPGDQLFAKVEGNAQLLGRAEDGRVTSKFRGLQAGLLELRTISKLTGQTNGSKFGPGRAPFLKPRPFW